MKGRLIACAFVLGTGLLQLQKQIAPWFVLVSLLLCAWGLVLLLRRRQSPWPVLAWMGLAAVSAFVNASWQAQGLLEEQLALSEQNKPFRLTVQVQSLVRLAPNSRSFKALVLDSHPPDVPAEISLSWAASGWAGPYSPPKEHDFVMIKPGQVWELTAFLKTPHGARNPHAFDYESYVFAQGIRATGSIRGEPVLISDQAQRWSVSLVAEMWRHRLREAMLPYVQSLRWGGVLLALSIGDQASIAAEDWIVFNRTGLTHLVSISGSHVTLLAAMSAVFFAWCWRRLIIGRFVFVDYVPAAMAAGVLALIVAGLYSLTAGFEVPARRTFIMFGVAVGSLLSRLPLSITQIIALAVVVVLAFDPWAILASGFWLSFGAVLVLVACAQWSGSALWQGGASFGWRLWQQWRVAALWQLIITFVLLPPLAFLFFEISLVSPLSNAYAIPLIGLLITPLALLFALLCLTPFDSLTQWVLWLSHGLLEFTMWLTVWLGNHPLASLPAARAPGWVLLTAIVGFTVALCFRFFAFAWLGWLLVLPSLFWRPASLPEGAWRLHALDVGQGSAIVVETANQTLLFDTGLRSSWQSDEGLRTVMPYLRSLGKTKIDVLVLSHNDLDHVGGTRSILSFFPVEQSYSSFDLTAYLQREARLLKQSVQHLALPLAQTLCERGHAWQVDGVEFRFLWPSATDYRQAAKTDKNSQSCVLQISGRYHRALLTGDIGVAQEQQLVEAGLLNQDVVVVGHHGSRTSSGTAFVQRVQAQIAIAQLGWWNRFGHPAPQVEQRWRQSQAHFYRTDFDGAVVVSSQLKGLTTERSRHELARYWQNTTGAIKGEGNY